MSCTGVSADKDCNVGLDSHVLAHLGLNHGQCPGLDALILRVEHLDFTAKREHVLLMPRQGDVEPPLRRHRVTLYSPDAGLTAPEELNELCRSRTGPSKAVDMLVEHP